MVVVGLVVVVAGVLLWTLRGDDTRATTSASSPAQGSAAVTVGSTDATGRARPARPGSLAGRVTRTRDGRGIAGAHVAIAKAELGASMFGDAEDPTLYAVTDANGAWKAPLVPPGTYVVTANARGFLPGSTDRLSIGDEEARGGVDFALDDGVVAIRGTVTDIGGGAVAGARVTATRDAATMFGRAELLTFTDDAGRYEISVADGGYDVTAAHEDYTDSTRRLAVRGAPVTADFTLTPGASIRGVVVFRDGTPVPGALVTASGGRSSKRFNRELTTGDAEGTFHLKGLGAGAIELTASGRGAASAAPTIVELDIGEQREDVRVIVDRAFSVSGTLVDKASGTPVPNVQVGCFSFTSRAAAFASSPSGADGAFEIHGVRPASYMLFAIGEEVMPEIGQPVQVVDQDVTGVVVKMGVGVTLTGRVEPPRVARIAIAPTSIGLGNMFEAAKTMLVRAESDAAGHFTLKHVPAGTFELTAASADGWGGKIDVTIGAADNTGVVVPMTREASVAGKVVDGKGAPVAGVRVSAKRARTGPEGSVQINFDPGQVDVATTTADGAFELLGLEAGTYTLRASDHQGPMNHPEVALALAKGAARTGVAITVEVSDGVIRGTVLGPDGKPAPDAWITAELTQEKAGDEVLRFMRAGERPPVLTNADGRFVVDKLREGTYRVVAEGARGASRVEKTDVATGSTITLKLASLGTLRGRVTSGGAPVATFEIACATEQPGADDERRNVTDPAGTYELTRLAPGDYTCHVHGEAGRGTGRVVVPAGAATLDVALEPWATIRGKVVSVLTKQPVKGVRVLAGDDAMGSGAIADLLSGNQPTTDASGAFVVPRVGPGKGKLGMLPPDGSFVPLAERTYEVRAGQQLDLGTIEIVPPRSGEAGTLGMSTEIKDGGLLIDTVRSGGPAEAAGILVGDRVGAINGALIASLTPAIAKLLLSSGSMSPGDAFALSIDRAGTPAQLTVTAVKW